MKLESIKQKQESAPKSSKAKLATLVLASLLTACNSHFPNDKFIWGVPDRSGKFNITYEHSEGSAGINYVHIDVDVKENGDEGYIAYITKDKKQYTISAKTMEELQSKLEYDLVITHSEYIKPKTQDNATKKIIDFADAYNMFLNDSEDTFIEKNSIETQLGQINSELEELKKDKGENTKQVRNRLQEEKKLLEKRLKEINKPIITDYKK